MPARTRSFCARNCLPQARGTGPPNRTLPVLLPSTHARSCPIRASLSGKRIKVRRGRRIQLTGTINVALPPDEAFILFTLSGERV